MYNGITTWGKKQVLYSKIAMRSAAFVRRDVGSLEDIPKERVRFSTEETDLSASYCSRVIFPRSFYSEVLFKDVSLSLRN